MRIRRSCRVLASYLTPDAVWRPGQEKGQGLHTGVAERARNDHGDTFDTWTASGPLSGPLAVHTIAGLTIWQHRT